MQNLLSSGKRQKKTSVLTVRQTFYVIFPFYGSADTVFSTPFVVSVPLRPCVCQYPDCGYNIAQSGVINTRAAALRAAPFGATALREPFPRNRFPLRIPLPSYPRTV